MTETSDIPQRRPFARIGHFVAARRQLVFDYFSAISGAGGRLVFSLAYFVALANTLSVAEFGMFATASAANAEPASSDNKPANRIERRRIANPRSPCGRSLAGAAGLRCLIYATVTWV